MISVVIPAYQEGEAIVDQLHQLFVEQHPREVLIIDASDKAAYERIGKLLDSTCRDMPFAYHAAKHRGRARQMNQGAAQSGGEILLFLHADTQLPQDALVQVRKGLAVGRHWGRFDVCFGNPAWPYRLIAFMMNWRSRLSGIATGDQAMFMTRTAFDRVGGFDDIPLMEDVNMSAKLKKLGRPLCLEACVTTSARRWEQNGVFKTILLMWGLRLAYWLGADPERLARWYRK